MSRRSKDKRQRARSRRLRREEARTAKREAAASQQGRRQRADDPIRGGVRFEVGPTRQWYIACLAPRMGEKAIQALRKQCVAVFQPRADRVSTVCGRRVVRSTQLLARRVFIGLPATVPLATIRAMPGITDIVSRTVIDPEAGGNVEAVECKPVRLDPLALQRFVDAVTRDEIVQPFGITVGQDVVVRDGPFASFPGVVEEIDEARQRFKVAVAIFGRATPVELGIEQFEVVA